MQPEILERGLVAIDIARSHEMMQLTVELFLWGFSGISAQPVLLPNTWFWIITGKLIVFARARLIRALSGPTVSLTISWNFLGLGSVAART